MDKIVVTGGLGYIGSHTVVELLNENFEVVIIDDLSNSTVKVLDGIYAITGKKPIFEKIDLKDKQKIADFFLKHQDTKGIIHFAASKAVGESVENPLLYYENNINTLVYVLKNMTLYGITNFVFSSSCTVYGQAEVLPIPETAPIKPAESPYGNTKQIGEEIIADVAHSTIDFKAIALRYFNPIGAHSSGKIGELPLGIPQNLVPYITQTAAGIRRELSVYGNDYPTHDGTCIRDYIHVVDLAKAHVVAIHRLLHNKTKRNFEVFNIGTGKGNSVLEVIKAFENTSKAPLNYKIAARRSGDVIAAYADTKNANEELGWIAEYSLEDALKSAWEWELTIRENK